MRSRFPSAPSVIAKRGQGPEAHDRGNDAALTPTNSPPLPKRQVGSGENGDYGHFPARAWRRSPQAL